MTIDPPTIDQRELILGAIVALEPQFSDKELNKELKELNIDWSILQMQCPT